MKSRLIIFLLAITTTLSAQVERPKWEFGGGIRLNYMKLTGGMSGYRNADGYSFDTKYNEIGMDTYSPSFAIALGGRYKKWNLEFGGSKGSYDGNFITTTDIVRDDVQIDSGAVVSGTLDLNMYALSTNFGLIQRKHDLGIGIGLLLLYMGSNYNTTDTYGQAITLGGEEWFPMPFLALGGRLKFGDFRISANGGGAFFNAKKDDVDYDVTYFTVDLNAAWDFLKKKRTKYSVDLGFRTLFLDMKIENENGWYKEKDNYFGPYISVRILFSSKDLWSFTKKKDRKKSENNE